MGLGYLGGLGNLDLGQLQDYPQGYLQGVNLPAGKEEVASNAQGNNAPQKLVQQIRNSGSENFNSADEVLQAEQGDQ